MTQDGSGRWGDLRTRLVSGLVMLVLGGAAVWRGGFAMEALAIALCAAMIWELTTLCAPGRGRLGYEIGVGAAAVSFAVLELRSLFPPSLGLLVLYPAAAAFLVTRDRLLFAVYGFAILLTGYGFVALREGYGAGEGLWIIVWILAVVGVSDVAGYFAGRTLGGPKFWPALSPKKTWSGTVAGWIGAVIVGLCLVAAGSGWGIVLLSPLVAFAGQMGDIAESWIKRRAGVKDSSGLIPGHGGALDRFDALIGAILLVLLVVQFGALPQIGG
ncbi:phosphatidate cytidylyltransferase [Paenirhodobacter enshiensis]|uniref:phosphatidate cytidylyltransferase n=1 Tax=Paenirhodobacter enshiensis TaxID=1105367 RepID=UPI0030E58FF4